MARIGQAYSPGSGGSGDSGTIPEYEGDPASPQANDVWVSKTTVYTPVGLLLSLTHGQSGAYQLSYKTEAGPIIRVTMS